MPRAMIHKEMRDIVYFDESKAASLHSQLVGGLTTEIVASEHDNIDKSGDASLDAQLLRLQINRSRSSASSYTETKILHHDILGRLEELLFNNGFALDLNQAIADNRADGSILRSLIDQVSYIRVESEASFHDHSRLIEITNKFPQLLEFISRCAQDSANKSEHVSLISRQIEEMKKEIKAIKDRNKRSKAEAHLKAQERKLNDIVASAIGENIPQDWFLEGLSNWVNMFNPDHLHVRFSIPNATDGTQVVANLQRSCFTDSSYDHVVFAYGRRTNVKLTLLGLITSIPENPRQESQPPSSNPIKSINTDQHVFENAFANVFDSIGEIEKFALVDNYPNIKVYPVAVYRSIKSYFEENVALSVTEGNS